MSRKETLLANDLDLQDGAGVGLSITSVSHERGGTAVLAEDGDVLFTPAADASELLGFQYTIADGDGNPGATVVQTDTGANAQMRAAVLLRTASDPTDPLLADQWYVGDTNLLPVWRDYSGAEVRIGQFEPGDHFAVTQESFDYRHPDLYANGEPRWLADAHNRAGTTFSNHATLVAGVMVADDNGEGGIGVAHDASLASYWIDGNNLEHLNRFQGFDVVNNPWVGTRVIVSPSIR